jgi:hypothetical protein
MECVKAKNRRLCGIHCYGMKLFSCGFFSCVIAHCCMNYLVCCLFMIFCNVAEGGCICIIDGLRLRLSRNILGCSMSIASLLDFYTCTCVQLLYSIL